MPVCVGVNVSEAVAYFELFMERVYFASFDSWFALSFAAAPALFAAPPTPIPPCPTLPLPPANLERQSRSVPCHSYAIVVLHVLAAPAALAVLAAAEDPNLHPVLCVHETDVSAGCCAGFNPARTL